MTTVAPGPSCTSLDGLWRTCRCTPVRILAPHSIYCCMLTVLQVVSTTVQGARLPHWHSASNPMVHSTALSLGIDKGPGIRRTSPHGHVRRQAWLESPLSTLSPASRYLRSSTPHFCSQRSRTLLQPPVSCNTTVVVSDVRAVPHSGSCFNPEGVKWADEPTPFR